MGHSDFTSRIVGYGMEPAGEFLANEANWRIHPLRQRELTGDALTEVGWVKPVLVNKRTSPIWGSSRHVETLIDGHLRVSIALARGEQTPVPVAYVDLTPEEEAYVLQTLDPLAALAVTDASKLLELAKQAAVGAELLRSAMSKADGDKRAELEAVLFSRERSSSPATPALQPSEQRATAAGAGEEKERRYPLAIAVTATDLARWHAWRARCLGEDDTAAFKAALEVLDHA